MDKEAAELIRHERANFEVCLAKSLPEKLYATVREASRYSLLAGGKRVRPLLLLMTGKALGLAVEDLYPWACALEMIHTYSLIHDDLPAMDNDDYRRGRLTNHKVYGEGQAILAGDLLLSQAFVTVSAACADASANKNRALRILADAAAGMVCGQSADLDYEQKEASLEVLSYIERHKTGCLLTAPFLVAGALAGASEEVMNMLELAGVSLGTAFQIYDDILDVEGSFEQLGKSLHKDENSGKATFVTCFGLEKAREEAKRLTDLSVDSLYVLEGPFAEALRDFVQALILRQN